MKYFYGCERRNNIFLYSRTSVIVIYIPVSFTHTGGLGASDILGSLEPNKYLGKLKIPTGRRARNCSTSRISNVRLSSGPTRGDEIIHLRFKGDTTNQSSRSISLASRNFSFSFPTSGLGLSAILRSLDYSQFLKVLFSYLDPVLINKERSRFVRCWHAETDGWAASTFHSNCDGRGPTVTIIKVNSYIFGGYTDVSWTSSE